MCTYVEQHENLCIENIYSNSEQMTQNALQKLKTAKDVILVL